MTPIMGAPSTDGQDRLASPCLALRRYAPAPQTASRASSVSTHMLTKDRRDGLRNAGGTGGPSAWELDCHASLSIVPQVRHHLRLSVGNRQVPFLTLSSGTQRAR